MMNMKMILASASPRRREILENLGIQFTVQSSDFDEREHIASEEKRLKRKLSPAEQAMSLALQKAQTVAERMDRYDAEEFIDVVGAKLTAPDSVDLDSLGISRKAEDIDELYVVPEAERNNDKYILVNTSGKIIDRKSRNKDGNDFIYCVNASGKILAIYTEQ